MMKHIINAPARLLNKILIANGALDQFDRICYRGDIFFLSSREIINYANDFAFFDEIFRKVRTNKAGAASY